MSYTEAQAQMLWRTWLSKLEVKTFKVENIGFSLPDLIIYKDGKITLHEIKLLKGNRILTSSFQMNTLTMLKEGVSLVVYDVPVETFSVYPFVTLVNAPRVAQGKPGSGKLAVSLKDIVPDYSAKKYSEIPLDRLFRL